MSEIYKILKLNQLLKWFFVFQKLEHGRNQKIFLFNPSEGAERYFFIYFLVLPKKLKK